MNEKNISLVRKMTSVFLKNKQLGVLIFFGILFSGVLGFFGMPKQYNPEITAPAFLVTTEYPGATAQEVHSWITKPMEDRIREISSLDTVSSFSVDGGVSRVLVKFKVGENEEDAKITLMQKFQSTFFLKPEGAKDPLIQALSPDDIPIVTVAITSESLSSESLRKLGYDFQEQFRGIEGVSGIDLYGGSFSRYEVSVDAKKISSLGIGMQEIYSALSSHNSYIYVGDIVSKNTSLPLKITSFFQNKEDIEKILITRKDQTPLYLGEIADVQWGETEITSHTSFLGGETFLQENAVYIAFSKKKGTNAIAVSKEINAKVESLKKEGFFFEYANTSVVSDDGRIAQEEIYGLTGNLFTSIGIVAIILFLFLGWRSALVVFTAIPLSLALVFLVGYLFNQTINRITLFALILSLGLLVDSAIVVIENIVQKTKQKKSLQNEDIVDAVDEVGVGLFLSTVTTILAFVPMAFVTGMMGPYMRPIPFFVPVALIASLFIAYTLNPLVFRWVISRFGKNSYEKPIASGLLLFARKVYVKSMRKIFLSSSLRKKLLLGSFFALIGSFLLIAFAFVPFRMLPKADKEQFFVFIDMPENTSFDRTEKISYDIASRIANHTEVKSVQIFVGTPAVNDFNGLFQGSFLRTQQYQATLRVSLSHPDTRKPFSQDIVSEIRKETLSQKENIGLEATLRFIEDPPGPPVESTFRLGIVSENENLRDEVTREIASFVYNLKGVVDIDTTLSRQTKTLSFSLDRERIKETGLSIEQVQKEMQFIFSDVRVGSFRSLEKGEKLFPEQEYIIVKTRKEDRDEVKDIDALFLSNSLGEMIPLSSVLIPNTTERPNRLLSEEYASLEYISGEMEN
ncbi:MAG: efflux RND transporter permease subunit, partial [Candidatus Moranbacteria bacterium]|nr:efflux RND transporter permease subunit [Candidatus Moranbacteria bacterium]